jgi:glycosyltransferase involved in cell wall biosynthesis
MQLRRVSMADRVASPLANVSPGFIALVPHDWNDQWLGRAQVMSRIAKRFHVVWCGPPHEWRSIPKRARSGPSIEQPVADLPMLHTYRAEPWLPRLYRPRTLASHLLQRRLEHARAILVRQGCTHIVLSIWTPQYSNVLPLVKHDMSMYHINDEYSYARVQQPISAEERVLMAGVDEVFIHSPVVMARKGALCSSATLTPNGVDFDAFAGERPMPDDLAAIPSPRIGYSGFLKTQLDWELLFATAQQNPQWSFVFVGTALEQPGLATTIARLETLKNVHFLGGKSSRVLSAYPQHFDVCMLPYCVDDYTKYIDPLKLSEYMASGRPAVGTPILPLEDVSSLVALAGTPAEWRQAISSALLPGANTPEERAKRQSWAKRRTWDALVDTILRRVEQHLGPAALAAPVVAPNAVPAPAPTQVSPAPM